MIVKVKDIKKYFGGVKAVNGITLEFAPKKITAIIGPNGSGKTTLLDLVTGMTPFDSGTISVAPVAPFKNIQRHMIRKMGITRTFQSVCVFEQMTVIDNILVVLTSRGVFSSIVSKHTDDNKAAAKQALEAVGLWELRDRLAARISYGQRKLLEIARILAIDADVYLFDEPFAGLFPEMITIVCDILLNLKKAGKTVVLIEHNLSLIKKVADILYVLDAGRLLAAGNPEQVLETASVKEAYLGE